MSMEKDFKGGIAVEAFGQDGFGNAIGILQHDFIGISRADGTDDAFADTGDDGLLGRAANKPVEMRAHRDTRFDLGADAVLCHAVNCRSAHRRVRHVDHLWINTGANGFENRFSRSFRGQIDGAGTVKVERYAGLVSGDQGENHLTDITARKIVSFQRIGGNLDARFHRRDPVIDNQANRYAAKAHADHFAHPNRRVRDFRAQPNAEEVEENDGEDGQYENQATTVTPTMVIDSMWQDVNGCPDRRKSLLRWAPGPFFRRRPTISLEISIAIA